MSTIDIQGLYSAMITPFGPDGQLDEALTEALMEFYIEKGLDGVFAVSNVGEFLTMPVEQRMAMATVCCRNGRGRLRVCPGVTDLDLSNIAKMAHHAKAQGADAVVLSPPYYYPYPAAYVEEFITAALDASPLPVIFYHSPKFACPVSIDFLLKVMAHPNIAAVKESSGDVLFLLKLMNLCAERDITTPVMLGWEELTLTGLVNGTKGCITSCAGIVPELLRGVLNAFNAGDMPAAAGLQRAVCRLTAAIAPHGFPFGYKMAMAARGFPLRILRSGPQQLEAELQAAVPALKTLIDAELAGARKQYPAFVPGAQ